MADTAITCISGAIKAIFIQEAKHLEDEKQRRSFLVSLDEIDDCPAGQLLGIAGGTSKSVRVKRAPSAYNLFLKKCASKPENGGRGLSFKQCTVEWKSMPHPAAKPKAKPENRKLGQL